MVTKQKYFSKDLQIKHFDEVIRVESKYKSNPTIGHITDKPSPFKLKPIIPQTKALPNIPKPS